MGPWCVLQVIGGTAASNSGGGGPVVLDDCNFHECVNVSEFETSRSLSFFPPDGEFVALNYRVTQVRRHFVRACELDEAEGQT